MKRVLCLWFPLWPLQRLCNAQPELKSRPLLLYQEVGPRGAQVVVCSRVLAEQGVAPTMPLAEAKALLQRTKFGRSRDTSRTTYCSPYDAAADLLALQTLAVWCERFSPLVGVDSTKPADSLLLDVTGCAHLFGGERALAREMIRTLFRQNLITRIAVADTLGAAWAVAHYGSLQAADPPSAALSKSNMHHNLEWETLRSASAVIASEEQSVVLDRLPVEALRLPERAVSTLHEFDIRQIGSLRALPRNCLPSRFGPEVVRRLDQAWGHLPEPIVPEHPPQPVEAHWSCEDPLDDRWAIETVLRQLLDRIIQQLASRHEGLLQLLCRLGNPKQNPIQFSVGLVQPTISRKHLCELVRMHLERVKLQEGVSEIFLRADVTASLEIWQPEMFDRGAKRQNEKERDSFFNRLSNRLGPEAVLRPRLSPDAQPEYASRYEPLQRNGEHQKFKIQNVEEDSNVDGSSFHAEGFASGFSFSNSGVLPLLFARPLHLKPCPLPVVVVSVVPDGPPIRMRWKNHDFTIIQSWGPERIETGWWRQQPAHRDYFRVETDCGRWFWLFRQIGESHWFLHGEF